MMKEWQQGAWYFTIPFTVSLYFVLSFKKQQTIQSKVKYLSAFIQNQPVNMDNF